MNFSSRTDWHRNPNRLTQALEKREQLGLPILDLTLSNPTSAGFLYPEDAILASLSKRRALSYTPDPRGLLNARRAVVHYYAPRKIVVDQDNIFITSGSSEAYSYLFRLLCGPGDNVLVPRPSYPLFDYLARINDVRLFHYQLRYEGAWNIDFDSCRRAITPRTKAIVLINPHNPTGMFLHERHRPELSSIALEHDLALIIDEVFIDYPLGTILPGTQTSIPSEDALSFTINGLSKSVGLPQMKAGWIAIGGPERAVAEAGARLEILADTFLTVNTPVQEAMEDLLGYGAEVQRQIRERVSSNYATLQKLVDGSSPISALQAEGGWYGIVRLPALRSAEDWCIGILEQTGVSCYPGYFFDFEEDHFLVVSLLPREEVFSGALAAIDRFVRQQAV